jgi:Putative bacterial sensory transduction regulator
MNPEEIPMALTNGRVAAQVHAHGIHFQPSPGGGVVAGFGDPESDKPAVHIVIDVDEDQQLPILSVYSSANAAVRGEVAIVAVSTVNLWNSTHRFPTAFVQPQDDGTSAVVTHLDLPAGAGLTDHQLFDLVGLAVSCSLRFWREYHGEASVQKANGSEEGAA